MQCDKNTCPAGITTHNPGCNAGWTRRTRPNGYGITRRTCAVRWKSSPTPAVRRTPATTARALSIVVGPGRSVPLNELYRSGRPAAGRLKPFVPTINLLLPKGHDLTPISLPACGLRTHRSRWLRQRSSASRFWRRCARRSPAAAPVPAAACPNPAFPDSRARTVYQSWGVKRRVGIDPPARTARNPGSALRPSAPIPLSSRPNSNLVSAMMMPRAESVVRCFPVQL